MNAVVIWIKEEDRKRQRLKRERDKNIKEELLKVGITSVSKDDLFELRRIMYQRPATGWRKCGWGQNSEAVALFYADENGKLVWVCRPERNYTPEEKQKIDAKVHENLFSGKNWNEGIEWPDLSHVNHCNGKEKFS